MRDKTWQVRTKRELMIEVWEALDCESVGANELRQIQEALRGNFGNGAVESPAAIARALADEGAMLRHPEVLMFDSQWREERLQKLNIEFKCASVSEAVSMMLELSERGKEFFDQDHDAYLMQDLVLTLKQQAEALASSPIVEPLQRQVAKEFKQWLIIWMQDPDMFENWLNLRQRSPEFQRLFGQH